ncbi:hypothetical protein L2K70_02250 [Nocardioides KLBMP 9356]|uniref:Uncharacterized protein n=1 Tax=Nocardioides potassii TaxID=2911371 RepID=A0ABS9H8I4_9ACTN|nr:hypothetical protein [Nocardioides potassii]MCF6376416.1 hypothetical protein [Nocardioides potassii]
MPRPDIAWGTNVELREGHWAWRHDIRAQVVNPDIDGLLTACLLHHLKGWPVAGFYDTQRLLMDPAQALPMNLDEVIWVDVDMCWPGARSLSQHVVLDAPSDATAVDAYADTVNPSLLSGHARRHNYTAKYPFGTFQWAWWLIGRRALPDMPDPGDLVMTGLAWMPDGGFQSVETVWRDNCVGWATQRMPGSILAPLATTDPSRARAAVAFAESELRRRSGVDRGWRNHQFTLTRGSGNGPVMNMSWDEAPGALQALCDAITGIYGWRRLVLPSSYDVHEGRWRTGDRAPDGWPLSANRREVVSLAVTSKSQFCWTEPGSLTAAIE